MFTFEKEGTVTLDQVMRVAADPGLRHSEIGIWIRLHSLENVTSAIVDNHVGRDMLNRLVVSGLADIVKVYRHGQDDPRKKQSKRAAWQHDKIIVLTERRELTSVFHVKFRRRGTNVIHDAVLSAPNQAQAIEDFGWLWPSHELVDMKETGLLEYDGFRELILSWSQPSPMRMPAFKKKMIDMVEDVDDQDVEKFLEGIRDAQQRKTGQG